MSDPAPPEAVTATQIMDLLKSMPAERVRRLAKTVIGIETLFVLKKGSISKKTGKPLEKDEPRYLRFHTIMDRVPGALKGKTPTRLAEIYNLLVSYGSPVTATVAPSMLSDLSAIKILTPLSMISGIPGSEADDTSPFTDEEMHTVEVKPSPKLEEIRTAATAKPEDDSGALLKDIIISKSDSKKLEDYVMPENFDFMVDAARTGDNLFFLGPPGSGKTEAGKRIAQFLDAEFIRQNFDEETTVDMMVGYSTIGLEGGHPVSKWNDAELSNAARIASGGRKVVYLADELPAAKDNVRYKFHRILERDGKNKDRSIEIDGKLIKIPGGMLTIIGTGNSFRADESGEYSGSNSMNKAFCTRWSGGVYFVDYSPHEPTILLQRGIPEKIVKPLMAMAKAIRKAAFDEHNPVACSTRQLLDIGEKAVRWGTRKAIEIVYLSTLLSDERKMVDPIVLAQKWPDK